MLLDPINAIIAGSTLLTVIGVEYGGVFLLSLLRKKHNFTPAQTGLFRAGHAHAGALITLGLLTLVLLNMANLGWPGYLAAIGVLVGGPILMPAGFFLSALRLTPEGKPGPLIRLVYVGGAVKALSLAAAGVLLITVGGTSL